MFSFLTAQRELTLKEEWNVTEWQCGKHIRVTMYYNSHGVSAYLPPLFCFYSAICTDHFLLNVVRHKLCIHLSHQVFKIVLIYALVWNNRHHHSHLSETYSVSLSTSTSTSVKCITWEEVFNTKMYGANVIIFSITSNLLKGLNPM